MKMSLGRRVIIGIFLTWLSLGLLQVYATNQLATSGETLNNLQTSTLVLEMENRDLNNQLSKLGSLNRIASDSAKLGFSEAAQFFYLPAPPSLAWGEKSVD